MNNNRFFFILIFVLSFFITIALAIGLFFSISTREKREELTGAAKKLLEKPIEIIMEKPKKKIAPKASEEKQPDEILVDDFDVGLTSGIASGRKNRVGAYQGTFAMRPSFALLGKSSEQRRGDHGQGLVIEYRKEAGWCGWYTLLNNIDVTPYNTLSFWVKGENDGDKFDIGLADSRMQDLGIDAFFLGCVTSFIPKGFISKEWKEVRVPLSRASSEINLASMGSLVFWFKYGGEGKIYVEDVKFKNDSEITQIAEYNLPKVEKDPLHPRALWVWKTDPVSSVKQRRELIDFCQKASISVIYLFFPEFSEMPPADYFNKLTEFLRESHEAEIKVEALTGNPVWSLAANHQQLLNWIKFFMEYNKGKTREEMVDGVSLDVEPYLTAEWEKDRGKIKKDYLDLLRKCRELIDSYGQEFRLGVAIPFFYDKEDDGKFERSILDHVDYIALMDYYDIAKDIIERARFHVDLAKQANKKVVIAVETQDLVEMHQGKRRNTFIEEGWEEMERQLDKVKQEFSNEASFEGFAIHFYDSYKLMTRGRNVPTRARPKDIYTIKPAHRSKEITIDGKLNDWDLSAPYEVSDDKHVVYGGGAWKGKEDMSYRVYTAWDEEALYFAIDVTDDKVVQQKSGADMWEGDHAELWLDIDFYTDLTETVNSEDDFQIGLSPGNFSSPSGTVSNLPTEVYIWTPALPDNLKYKDLINVASSRASYGYIIEVRIPKEVLFYNNTNSGFSKGLKLGIMVDMGDTDDPANPMKSLMSTSKDRVWGDPTTFGVMELE